MLEKLKTAWNNFRSRPFSFIFRQVYRLLVLFPYEIAVSAGEWVTKLQKHPQAGKPTVPFCFIVTSVIYPLEKKNVSFDAKRTIFSPEVRAEQTLETIRSIRQYAPGVKIALVEGGLKDMSDRFASEVDQYIYAGDKRLVRFACDGTSKSLGEVSMIIYASSRLQWDAEHYCKISGRYCLNDEFRLDAWREQAFMFFCLWPGYYSTRLYGFSRALFIDWKYALIKGLPYHLIDYPVENTIAKFTSNKKYHQQFRLGVTGRGGSNNDLIKE